MGVAGKVIANNNKMSSRAFRRLHGDANVIKLPSLAGEEDEMEEPVNPNLQPETTKQKVVNPFELLTGEDGMGEQSEEEEVVIPSANFTSPAPRQGKKRKKKKKKGGKGTGKDAVSSSQLTEESPDEVEAAIREVSKMLGGLETTGSEKNMSDTRILHSKNLLCVNRRFLNADNEMRRIFGSRVVRAEQSQRRDHRKKTQRQTILVSHKDTWPLLEKLGISMQVVEVANGCHYFTFEHSQEYQKIQFDFLDAVETYDPNSIAVVLHAHPYHIDSLLQLSEVCKMGEDMQMAADLIERALYQFECSFHPLFNLTQDNCRLNYSRTENRSFFLALFRHLNYVERKGCHRTAFELCKLLLSLAPDTDPLCVLLMIDYHSLRAYEYKFLIDFQDQWESKKNLTQLPNFAFSIPLAMFLCTNEVPASEDDDSNSSSGLLEKANERIQEALIMFPSLLVPLLNKCGASLHPTVMSHTLFSCSKRDPDALQLLIKLYIERTHSLWKVPEVLEWLGTNALSVVKRADDRDPLIGECDKKRQLRYIGTPRNISRHVILSDLENTTSALPRDVTGTPIMMYDPLPPEDSMAGYSRPPRTRLEVNMDPSNPFMLFLRSLLPSFNPANTEEHGPQLVGVPHHAPPPNHQGAQQGNPPVPGMVEGAVGGVREGFALENAILQLTTSLRGLLDQLQVRPGAAEDQEEEEEEEEDNDN